MRTERAAFVLAVACGVLLLFAPLTPRTTWIGVGASESGGTGGMRHSAGWEWVAPLCGLVALSSMAFGRWARPVVVASGMCSVVASVAFVIAGLAAGGHWRDAVIGSLDAHGFVTHPAPAAPFFAVVAALGAASALLLALAWLRTPGAAA